jgi:uncharacterized protein (DUF2267 family)
MNAIVDIDAAVYATESWIDDLMRRLGWHDRERVYLALLSTLHALRDSLPRDEAIYLAAQLPPLLRGLYYEGWHLTARPSVKSRNAFLTRIHDGLHRDPGVDPEHVARAVLAMLTDRLPPAEVEDTRAATPSALHSLWPS